MKKTNSYDWHSQHSWPCTPFSLVSKLLIFLVALFVLMNLASCGNDVKLQDDFIGIESVQALSDSSFVVNLKCGNNAGKSSASFTSPYRYQAGDTLWTESQLKKHYNKLAIELSAENKALKDSAFFYRVSLGNKIDDLNKQVKELQMQNNALQKAFIKLK